MSLKTEPTLAHVTDKLHRALSIQSKIQQISVRNQMERTISVWSERNILVKFEGGPLWPVRSFRSVGPKCAFLFDKIVLPSTTLLQ